MQTSDGIRTQLLLVNVIFINGVSDKRLLSDNAVSSSPKRGKQEDLSYIPRIVQVSSKMHLAEKRLREATTHQSREENDSEGSGDNESTVLGVSTECQGKRNRTAKTLQNTVRRATEVI